MTDNSKPVRLIDVMEEIGYARSDPQSRLGTLKKLHPELADVKAKKHQGVLSITKAQANRIRQTVSYRNGDKNGKESVQKRGVGKDGVAQLYFFLERPIGDDQNGPRRVKIGYWVDPEESISALPPGDLIGSPFECEPDYVRIFRDSVATPLEMVKDPEKEDWYVLPEGKSKERCEARWQEVAEMSPAASHGC